MSFIFGKNGTGKSTISDEIEKQFTEDYDVHVFRDFDGVVENDRLNAVALGVENAEIQKDIQKIDKAISLVDKQITLPEPGVENLFSTAVKAERDFKTQDRKVEDFYVSAARQIKNISNPTVALPTYNRNTFLQDIPGAVLVTDDEVAKHRETMRSDKKDEVSLVAFPAVNLGGYLTAVNEILETKVKQPHAIPELNNNTEKQNFARQGMDVHDHTQGELCAFCGNEISEDRWVALGNYFNNEVKALETRITNGIAKIDDGLSVLARCPQLDKGKFYSKYNKTIDTLGTSIELKKKEHEEIFKKLKDVLEVKSKQLFIESDELALQIPDDFSAIQKEYNDLVSENNKLSKNLASEQNKAKDALRLHEVKKRLEAFKYEAELTKFELLRELRDAAQNQLKLKQDEKVSKQNERAELISQTKDEEKIAREINTRLATSGVVSFSLKHIIDEDEGQKGQYQILGHDGKLVRPITNLSRGEKNIIAFLYFMLSLDRPNRTSKPRFIVLDDPMTSNDDTMQYLMIGEIQRYYRKVKDDDAFLLLTHNTHFYLNARNNTASKYGMDDDGNEIKFYDKYGVFHLMRDGKLTSVKTISKGKDDFTTSYGSLWKELVFLYAAPGATPDIMLGPCRRICETYMHFTKIEGNVFYKDNPEAKNLFDVNQHAIDDHEAEHNGKTRDQIKDILRDLFKQNNAEDHFTSYWKTSSS